MHSVPGVHILAGRCTILICAPSECALFLTLDIYDNVIYMGTCFSVHPANAWFQNLILNTEFRIYSVTSFLRIQRIFICLSGLLILCMQLILSPGCPRRSYSLIFVFPSIGPYKVLFWGSFDKRGLSKSYVW